MLVEMVSLQVVPRAYPWLSHAERRKQTPLPQGLALSQEAAESPVARN